MTILAAAILFVGAPAAWATDPAEAPLDAGARLRYHIRQTVSPEFPLEMAAYAAVLHGADTPREWGQGGPAYGKRVASASGATAIRNVFAFALDATLREDPRYRRGGSGGWLRRSGHAVRETFLTHTDSGRTRPASWRFGSAIGAAFLSNAWYPDRLSTFGSGMEQAAATIGLDLLGNLASEFWPDIKHKRHRRP
jgi:hypothetical protein